MDNHTTIEDCKKILQAHYADRFRGLLLYGSLARGQQEDTSDIDLLVLLSNPFDYFEEIRKIIEILYPVQLKSERLISAKPVSLEDFESGKFHLYRMAKREGIAA
jgi:predicted nucleotidyltransferase